MAQFHWGGGTPTYLSPEQIEDLFTYTRERFTFAPDAEIGIEVDPRVTTRAHLETVRKMGFNRLSMGIQDFKPEVQKAIHRIQPYEQTRDLIADARELGFDSINVDLIYGLPYQTAESFTHTVEQIVGTLSGPHRHVQLCPCSMAEKAAGFFRSALPEGMQKFEIFRSGLLAFVEAGISTSGWTISPRTMTNSRYPSAIAHCIVISRGTPRRQAPTSMAWASPRSAESRIATRKISAIFPHGKKP